MSRSRARTAVLPLRGPGSGFRGARDAGRGCEQGHWAALAAGRGAPPDPPQRTRAPTAWRVRPRGQPYLRGAGRRGEGRGDPRPRPRPRPAPPPRPRSIPPAPGSAPRLLTEGSPPRQRRARPATARLAAAASFLPAARDPRFRVSAPIPPAPPARPPARGPGGAGRELRAAPAPRRCPSRSSRPFLRARPPAATPFPFLPKIGLGGGSLSRPYLSARPTRRPQTPEAPAFPVPSLRPASTAGTAPLHSSRHHSHTFGLFREAPRSPVASSSLAWAPGILPCSPFIHPANM